MSASLNFAWIQPNPRWHPLHPPANFNITARRRKTILLKKNWFKKTAKNYDDVSIHLEDASIHQEDTTIHQEDVSIHQEDSPNQNNKILPSNQKRRLFIIFKTSHMRIVIILGLTGGRT